MGNLLLILSGAAIGVVAYVSVLPGADPDYGDSVVMALIHLPVALLALAFLGESRSDTGARIRFVRYNGELLILGTLVGLGGMVLSGVPVGLST